MKRNRFAFLLFVTSLLFLPVFVSAQAVISALPVGDENLPDIGDLLSVNIDIADGKGVAGFEFKLTYSDAVLEFSEAKLGDFLPAGAFAVPPRVEGGTILYGATAIGATAVGTDGTLATFTFKVLAQKESDLTFLSAKLSDAVAKEITSTTKAVTIKAEVEEQKLTENNEIEQIKDDDNQEADPILVGDSAVLSVNPAKVVSPSVGETLNIVVSIANATDVAGFEFKLAYDDTALEFSGIKLGSYLPTGAFAVPVKAEAGTVLYGATAIGAKSVKSNGELASLSFNVIIAKPSAIEFLSAKLSDPNAKEIPSSNVGAKIIIKEAEPVITERQSGGQSLNLQATVTEEGQPVNLQTIVSEYKEGKVAAKGTFIEYQVKFSQDSAIKTGGVYIHTDKGNILGPDGLQAMRSVEDTEDSTWTHARISLDPIAGEKIVAITTGTRIDSAPKGLFSMLVDNIQLTDGDKIVESIWLSKDKLDDQSDLKVYGDQVGVEQVKMDVAEEKVSVEPKDKMLTSWGQIKSDK
ncbi:hypothetical protein CMK13_19260 [Candidatus Poribacteria bacterium]|nr:hypothetical protein [Candidatus Poribacteria bacterium]OUT53969.1 MAG: hypothetical protein CBB75_18510 [bacterium TMED15]